MCPCPVMPVWLDNVYIDPNSKFQQAVEYRVPGEKSGIDKCILASTI